MRLPLLSCVLLFLGALDKGVSNAMQADCTNGELRLVGGSTYREGRVEVCVDGCWGTVCLQSEWTAEVAGFVCSELGFSQYNATCYYPFGGGSGPVYTYTCQPPNSFNPNCIRTDAPPGCEYHSLDAGVRCQPCSNACPASGNNRATTEEMSTTTSEPTTTRESTATTPSTRCDPSAISMTTTKSTTTKENKSTTSSSNSDSTGETTPPDTGTGGHTNVHTPTTQAADTSSTSQCQTNTDAALKSTNEALGALTGLLAAALVAVTMGWIVSCVCWWRRKNHTHKTTTTTEGSSAQRQLDNPVYDGGIGMLSQTNFYSSLGPAYEHVGADTGRGYDVINQRRAARPRPHMTQPRSHDPTLNQNYSLLEEDYYHVLESSEVTGKKCSVLMDGRIIVQKDQTQTPSEGEDPMDHEIPTPRASIVQNT